jgi:tRNA threonylcarbamoyladenosine biosynthesis protein TsaE
MSGVNTQRVTILSESPDATRAIGRAIARRLRAGDVILLHGDLGAGKTTLTQGIGEGLLVQGAVQSPTFILVDEHDPAPGGLGLNHVDLYRLERPEQIESLGFNEYLDPRGAVTVIEWPERAGEMLPATCLVVTLDHAGEARQITLAARGGAADAERWLNGLSETPRARD